MPKFKGFNTINQDKKYSLYDVELITQDLYNAFHIREGEVAGRPDLGTTIWSFIFDPLDSKLLTELEAEVRRVVSKDIRLNLEEVKISSVEQKVIIELNITILLDANLIQMALVFDEDSRSLTITNS